MNNNYLIKINKNDTMIILDWDDTLFPTSWLLKNNIDLNNIEVRNRMTNFFSSLDNILYIFLKKCMSFGTIIIVTNALPIWVHKSSLVIPNTHTLLAKIKIISARKNHQKFSKNMMDWKKMAFKNEAKNLLENKKIVNIISIGDAEYEYNALIDLYEYELQKNKIKKILKSIKLIKDPNYELLLDQLEVLNDAIHDIVYTSKHLDLNFNLDSNRQI